MADRLRERPDQAVCSIDVTEEKSLSVAQPQSSLTAGLTPSIPDLLSTLTAGLTPPVPDLLINLLHDICEQVAYCLLHGFQVIIIKYAIVPVAKRSVCIFDQFHNIFLGECTCFGEPHIIFQIVCLIHNDNSRIRIQHRIPAFIHLGKMRGKQALVADGDPGYGEMLPHFMVCAPVCVNTLRACFSAVVFNTHLFPELFAHLHFQILAVCVSFPQLTQNSGNFLSILLFFSLHCHLVDFVTAQVVPLSLSNVDRFFHTEQRHQPGSIGGELFL